MRSVRICLQDNGGVILGSRAFDLLIEARLSCPLTKGYGGLVKRSKDLFPLAH